MLNKYQQLKDHIRVDYPQVLLTFRQEPEVNGYFSMTSSGPHITVESPDYDHLTFAALLHEIGHYLSFLAGNHSDEFRRQLIEFNMSKTKLGFSAHSPLVMAEEERAWTLGEEYAARHSLYMEDADRDLKKERLNTYLRTMGLPTI